MAIHSAQTALLFGPVLPALDWPFRCLRHPNPHQERIGKVSNLTHAGNGKLQVAREDCKHDSVANKVSRKPALQAGSSFWPEMHRITHR